MTSQDKKAYLARYRDIRQAIDQRLDEAERLRALAEKTTSTLSDMPKGGGSCGREDTYARLVDLGREIDREIGAYVQMRGDVEQAINTVGNMAQRNLLRYRYVNGWKWEKIAVEMNFDYRWILRLHGRALESMQIVQIGH